MNGRLPQWSLRPQTQFRAKWVGIAARRHGLHSRRSGLKSADPTAEVLQLLVDGVVGVLQLLAEREKLGLEAFGSGGLL
eukprot:6905408-Alexandrium_andersonii.AAC.1